MTISVKAILHQLQTGQELIEVPPRPAGYEAALAELSENDRKAILDYEAAALAILREQAGE